MDRDAEWKRLLDSQRGLLSTRQAAMFVSESTVRHKLARGDWRRPFAKVIITTPGAMSVEQQWFAAVLAADDNAVLAGVSAAQASGLSGRLHRVPIDVLVPAERRARRVLRPLLDGMSPVVVHRTTLLGPGQIQPGRPNRTVTPRSIIDAAQWADSDEEARLVVAMACQQRRVTPKQLFAAVADQARAKRRRLILETARYAEGGATTLTEIGFARLCARHGLPKPDLQERRKDGSGRVRYLDAYWRRFRLHVEIDGSHHMDVEHWSADMLRQNEVWLKGDRVLRFPAFLIAVRPDLVIAQLRSALSTAGWRDE